MSLNPRIGEIFKFKEPSGEFTFVEIKKTASWVKLKKGEVYVITRTPYPTSIYGQIETAGTIAIEKLINVSRADQKILGQLKKTEREGIRRSKIMYESMKHNIFFAPSPILKKTKVPKIATQKITKSKPKKRKRIRTISLSDDVWKVRKKRKKK